MNVEPADYRDFMRRVKELINSAPALGLRVAVKVTEAGKDNSDGRCSDQPKGRRGGSS